MGVWQVVSQQAHDVNTTSPQRRCNDVEPTLYKRHLPAGVDPDQMPLSVAPNKELHCWLKHASPNYMGKYDIYK